MKPKLQGELHCVAYCGRPCRFATQRLPVRRLLFASMHRADNTRGRTADCSAQIGLTKHYPENRAASCTEIAKMETSSGHRNVEKYV